MAAKLYNFQEERAKRRPNWPQPHEWIFNRNASEQLANQIDHDILAAIVTHKGQYWEKEESNVVP